MVSAKGIGNLASDSANAGNNNSASVWASAVGNMGLDWARGLANLDLGSAREATSSDWGKGGNVNSMGLVSGKETSMVMIGGNEWC